MSVYWNRRVKNIVPYVAGEQPRDRKFIKLNTNENPYPPSPLVVEAIQKAVGLAAGGKADGEALRLYPDPACTELREAVAERYGVKTEQVFAGNGSDEILAFAFAAFFGENRPLGETRNRTENQLLFPDITYSFYPVYSGLWDIPYKTVPLKQDFSIDPGDYLGSSGGIAFPNPNAPTGMALPLDMIRKIAGAAKKNNQVFLLDEAYIAFAGGESNGFTGATCEAVATALPLIREFPNLLIVRTLSKEASLAGLRAGFAVGHEDLTEALCRVRDSFNSYTMDRLALAGAAAAVRDKAYYDGINRRVIATRNRVSQALSAMGFRALPSGANFIFAEVPPDSGKTGQEFYSALRERGFLVRHFNKNRIAGFLRISMGKDDDMDALLDACLRIVNDKE